jgi:hypothetical protein
MKIWKGAAVFILQRSWATTPLLSLQPGAADGSAYSPKLIRVIKEARKEKDL